MSERYTRLFSLPENLYMEGAPVIIAAGALLKDNQTGKVLAQLKIRNIQGREIKAATVSVSLLDTAGRALGGAVVYQYLDIAAGRDADFGQKTPVYLSESAARSYTVSVTEVVFSGNTVWTASEGEWTPLAPSVPLETALGDGELVKQYRLTYGSDSVDKYQTERDLWHCSCGALNHRQEVKCHICGKEATALAALDMDALSAARDQRVEEEWQRAREARIAEEERLAAERIEREKRLAAAKAEEERRRAEAEARARIVRKRVMIAAPTAVALLASVLVVTQVILPGSKYAAAEALADAGQYEEAVAAFEALGDYRDSMARIEQVREAEKNHDYEAAVSLMEAGRYDEAIAAFNVLGEYQDSVAQIKEAQNRRDYAAAESLLSNGNTSGAIRIFEALGKYRDAHERYVALFQAMIYERSKPQTIAAGGYHTLGLRSDGTVVAVGNTEYGECAVDDWTEMSVLDAGECHTVGLRSDGTVAAVGFNDDGRCNVRNWTNIAAVSAGGFHTVGLRSDGTVVAVGYNFYGQCNVSGWSGIAAVAGGHVHTVGLRSDGTVVAVGWNDDGQCNVGRWTDIIAISAGGTPYGTTSRITEYLGHTVGLRFDGTVVAAGNNRYKQCNVGSWTDIVAVAAGGLHTVGLRSDGTVVAVGSNEHGQCNVDNWTDIVAISAKRNCTVGVRSDGTVVAVGSNKYGQCNVESWTDIRLPGA